MNKLECDQNIVKELKNLPVPLKTFNGKEVVFVNNKRGETIYEHIAKKNSSFAYKRYKDNS